MSSEALTVDDLVTGKAADELGEGILPVAAVLIIETIDTDGPGLRFIRSEGLSLWHALGMVRSVTIKLEEDDLDSWREEE